MKILGITGPTGAGKSLLCRQFSDCGIPVIDADEVYHQLLLPPSPCLDALQAAFGDTIFNSDGTLNRPALSEIVFRNEEKLRLLNHTVLGFVLEKIRAILREWEQNGVTCAVLDAPTLIESGFHRECHTVISVLAPRSLRIERIRQRDALTEQQATDRINAQKSDDFYRSHSDYVLINDGNEAEFLAKAQALTKELSVFPSRTETVRSPKENTV